MLAAGVGVDALDARKSVWAIFGANLGARGMRGQAAGKDVPQVGGGGVVWFEQEEAEGMLEIWWWVSKCARQLRTSSWSDRGDKRLRDLIMGAIQILQDTTLPRAPSHTSETIAYRQQKASAVLAIFVTRGK